MTSASSYDVYEVPRMILQARFCTLSNCRRCVTLMEEDQAGDAYSSTGRMNEL